MLGQGAGGAAAEGAAVALTQGPTALTPGLQRAVAGGVAGAQIPAGKHLAVWAMQRRQFRRMSVPEGMVLATAGRRQSRTA